jgi:arginine exporter protein ArgO
MGTYITTFFFTLTNPATILDFAALFTGLNIDVSGYLASLSFIGGVFVGSVLWWFMLCFTVGLFRKKVSIGMLRYINYIAGTAIFSFGLYALSKLWVG